MHLVLFYFVGFLKLTTILVLGMTESALTDLNAGKNVDVEQVKNIQTCSVTFVVFLFLSLFHCFRKELSLSLVDDLLNWSTCEISSRQHCTVDSIFKEVSAIVSTLFEGKGGRFSC